MGHRADESVADNLRGLVKRGNRALPRAHLPDDAVLPHRAHNGLLFGDGVRKGFSA
jgi:hypothetical protein